MACSDNVTKIVGYEPADFLRVPRFWVDRVHPEDRERILGELPRLFERGTYTYEYRFLHKDGAYIWVRDEMKLVRDAAGKPAEIIGFWIDITERKRAEEGAAREQNLLRTLIDNIPDEIYVKDAESRFILYNRAVAEHRGATGAEELIGKTDFNLYPRQEAQHCYEQEQQIMRSGKPMNSFLQADCDQAGNEIIGLTTKIPLRDTRGEVVGVVGISRNVTEEKKAERALTEERNLLRAVIENTPDQVYVKDAEGRFVLCNEAVAKRLGKQVSDVTGKTDFDLFDKELAEEFFAEEQDVLRTGRALENKETYGIDCQGKEGWALATKAPLRDGDGRITGIVGINRDITERKRAEEEMRELAKFPSENPYPVLRIHRDGTVLYANKAGGEILKAKGSGAGLAAPVEWRRVAEEVLASGRVAREEMEFDGRIFAFRAAPIAEGNYVNFYGADITEQKKAEEERELMIKLLSLINSNNQMQELMRLVTVFLKDWSGCEAVGIRLRDGEDYPYFVTSGFPEEFVQAESKLCSVNEVGELVRDSQGRVFLECMCGNIISGRFDPSKPFFTEHGSFWTNSTTELLAGTTNAGRLAKTRNRCNTAGYESVALVPLRTRGGTFGLLQFNSKQRDRFTAEKISLLERLADNLAIGLAQRRADEALRESEERFRSVFEQAADSIVLIDMETGAMVEFNDKAHKNLGYSRDEFSRLRLSDIEFVESQEDVARHIERIVEEGRDVFETKQRAKDGSIRDILVSAEAITVGRKRFIQGIWHDITERKRAEEELSRERNLLRILIDNIPDRVYVKDRESRFLLCNSAVAEHEGKKRTEDVIGKTDFDFYPEDKAAIFHAKEQKIMRTGQPMINREELCEDKSGNTKSVLSTKIPFRDSEGNVVGIVGINRDITERKRAEEGLIRLNKVMGTITDVNQSIFRIKDRDKLLRTVCERIVEHAYKMVWIGFCDEKSKLIAPQAQAGFEEGYLASVKMTCNDSEYGMGPSGMAVKTGKPDVMRFIATDERYKPWREEAMKRGYRSSAAIPIFSEDKVIGALNVYADKEDAFGQEEVKLLEELAHDISTGLRGIDEEERRRRAEERILEYQSHLKNLASQLTLAEERERRRIAGELHDQVSQSLALAKIKLDALRASATSKRPEEVLADVSETIEKAIGDTRSLTFDLSCPTLYELGFEAAVSEWLEEKIGKEYGIKTEFEDDGSSKPLLDDVRVLMFRSVRELLINVVKHSQASQVKVVVRKADDEIEVRIEDNGIGFNPQEAAAMAARRGEFGLFNIKERLEEVGGKLLIESAPGAGCKATIRAPLKRKGIDDERNKAAHQGNGN